MRIIDGDPDRRLEIESTNELETILFVSSAYGARRHGIARRRYWALGRQMGRIIDDRNGDDEVDGISTEVILEPRDATTAIRALRWYSSESREREGDFMPTPLQSTWQHIVENIDLAAS